MLWVKKFVTSNLVKYGLLSGVALVIDVFLLAFSKEVLNFGPVIAATVGFVGGLIFIYITSVKFVFGRSKYSRSVEVLIFLITGIIGLLINDVIIAVVTRYTDVYLAKFLAIFVVFTWNYLARKKLMEQQYNGETS